jgi:hypothetical protein
MERATPNEAADETPARTGSRRGWLPLAITAAIVGGVCLAGLAAARHEPAFYRAAGGLQDPSTVDPLARRMMSKASALHAAASRVGEWAEAISDREVNAWLATDLPRNHRGLLPRGISQPRVAFQPHRLQVGARAALGPLTAVVWADVEVWLKGVDQLGLRIVAAGIGNIPMPRDATLRRIASRLAKAGFITDMRRADGRAVLVVSPPMTYDHGSRGWRLESLAIAAGELLLAGSTSPTGKGAEPK